MENEKKTMLAVVMEEFGKLVCKEVPIPVPKKGEVLVKVEASPIHPFDMSFVEGKTDKNLTLPVIPGIEGAGRVVASGGGIFSWWIMNKRVAFAQEKGSWSQYVVLPAQNCVSIENNVSFAEGSCSVINPLTVLGMFSIVEQKKTKAIIQTASCSNVGRMFLRYCQSKGVSVVNVVRKNEQKEENAECVLNLNDEDFEERLKGIVESLKITIAFDAIGGKFLDVLLRSLPKQSTVYAYGALSGEESTFNMINLIKYGKKIESYSLTYFLENMGLVSIIQLMNKKNKFLQTHLKSIIAKEIPMQQIHEGIQIYKENMTKGKLIIKPWGEEEITTNS